VVRALTQEVRELAEGQARLTEQVRELTEGQARLTDQVRELAAGHASLTQQVHTLADQVRELAAGHASLTQQVHALADQVRELAAGHASLTEQVRELTSDVRALVDAQRRTDDRLGRLEGSDLERRYRERASGFFQQILTRVRLVDHQDLGLLLDDAVEAGTITPQEKGEILLADVIVRGRRDQRDTYALAEVSVVVDAEDVRRAAARARLLERVVGAPVLAVVAGRQATQEAARDARSAGVWSLLNGRTEGAAEATG
jgi:outer membrane murein-binding lipoprotein Lpp